MLKSLLALVALVVLAPLVAGQSHHDVGGMAPPPPDTGYSGGPVVVPLYGHIYDLLQPVPMNTQPMIDLDLARGFGVPSFGGAGPVEGAFSDVNHMRFYSSPGLVEYNETDDSGLPRYHPERGVSFDVLLDQEESVVGHWFMSSKALDVPQLGLTSGPEAGLMPGFTVRMTMRAGDDVGADLDAGEIIAEGVATLSDPTTWVVAGEVVEFVVDMGPPRVDRIRGNDAFNVKVEWFNADADGSHVTQRDWVLHTGERHPNRVDLTVRNPIAVYDVHPTPLGSDAVAVHTEFNSPFGNYDVDASTIEIEIAGPGEPRSVGPPRVVQKSYGHNHHYEPVQATWVWPFEEDGAAPGRYEVTVRATNLQGTATAEKTAYFVIPERGRVVGYDTAGEVVDPASADDARATSSPGATLAFAVLSAVALAAGQRRR